MDLRSLRNQRAKRVTIGEPRVWMTMARKLGTGVCDSLGEAVQHDDQVWVSHEHSRLKWTGYEVEVSGVGEVNKFDRPRC